MAKAGGGDSLTALQTHKYRVCCISWGPLTFCQFCQYVEVTLRTVRRGTQCFPKLPRRAPLLSVVEGEKLRRGVVWSIYGGSHILVNERHSVTCQFCRNVSTEAARLALSLM